MSEAPKPNYAAAPSVADPFRFMADHASDAFFLVDADGRIAYANRVAHVERGYAPGELVGQPLSAFTHSDDVALWASAASITVMRLVTWKFDLHLPSDK